MIKKLCLGTVQFGLDYGINNNAGKPIREKSFEMIDMARDSGINIFDTAAAYGDAEELLGEYIKKRNCKNYVKVISKLRPNLIEEHSENISKIIENETINSLKKLKIDLLEGYLLHTPTNFYNNDILEGLISLKEKQLVKNIGVSIYEYEHALDVVKSEKIDFIQVPYSVFDQRIDTEDFFHYAKKNNVKIFARSSFLQGLLTMDIDKIPQHLNHAKEYIKIYDEILEKYGMSRIEGALKFALGQPDIDYVVFGVDNKEQLVEDISISKTDINCMEFRAEIKEKLKNIEKNIIFPSLWSKK